MTTEEFKKKLKAASNFKTFNKLELVLNFNKADVTRKLVGFIDIHDYLMTEKEAWQEDDNRYIESEFKESPDRFSDQINVLEGFFNNYRDVDVQQLLNQWENESKKMASQIEHAWPHDSPRVVFLKKLNEKYGSSVKSSAMKYFKGDGLGSGNFDFIGYLKAYEFDQAEESMFETRRELENSSFKKLRANARASQTKLTKEIEGFINTSESSIQQKEVDFDEMKKNKSEQFEKWFKASNDESDQFFVEASTRREQLEKTYNDFMSLSKPAEFWKKRANRMRIEGWIALGFIAVFVYTMVKVLSKLLFETPDGLYESVFSGDVSAIKWTIVYITLISFLAFVLKVISKFAFSSFHLSRDAQEREMLTFVYLALKNEKGSDFGQEDKSLILQSLFSRADSGLLKEDSSPTMPSFVERIVNK